MSMFYGYFSVSSTKIAVLGYTKQNVFFVLFLMALYIPFHLWQRTSRIYQDLLFICPNFLRSAIHNPGVSLAPRQGLALWNLFLPTTRSFFVFITDLLSVTASFRWTFPITVCFLHPFTMIFFSYATFNCGLLISCSIFAPS
mgnify:CR=1 FL=1